MSDEGKSTESLKDALLGLNSLDIGPAWARGAGGEKQRDRGEGGGKRRSDERGDDRRREGKGGKGSQGRRFDNRDRERDERGGRERRGGGGRGFEKGKGGRHRRDDSRGQPLRQESPPPEGFTAVVMPVEDGLDGLAKEIMAGGRTYSVFDVAKLVLGARDRFNVSFQAGEDGKMFRCRKDDSLWLSKEEALRQFWRSDWREDYYEEVVSEAKPPAGNFQAVARCGISGEWLGPPNYHGYQPAVARLHRERFSNMALDDYKKKVRMERGEEAVNAWLEKMSKRIRYRPTGGGASGDRNGAEPNAESLESAAAGADEPKTGEGAAEQSAAVESPEASTGEETAKDAPATDDGGEDGAEQGAVEAAGDTGQSDPEEDGGSVEPAQEADAAPANERAEVLLDDDRAVERHFLEHHFDEVFQVTRRAWVSGNVPGNHLSPGLLTLLRHTVAEERRYPGRLTPMLCRQLSGRHVAVFKWQRKLKAGPSRPHPVPTDIAMADRPNALLTWITENSGRKLQHLWKALLPEKVSDEEKRGWYHDLHWLLNQGYVLLMADSSVHLAKKSGQRGEARPGKGKAKKAPAGQKPAASPPAAKESGAETGERTVPSRRAAQGRAGLYALAGRSMSGQPKVPEALSGKGLWPQLHRLEAENEEDEEESEERW